MSRQKIPAKTLLTCDRCGKTGTDDTDDTEGPFYYGAASIQADIWGRGHDGAIGGAKAEYDYCTACTESFHEWRQENGLALAKKLATMLGKRISDCADPEHHGSIRSAIQELEMIFGLKEDALDGVWAVYKDAYDRSVR